MKLVSSRFRSKNTLNTKAGINPANYFHLKSFGRTRYAKNNMMSSNKKE